MKKAGIILLLFSLFSFIIFSESKEYRGTGIMIFQKYGCPEAPESSTCARYRFISETKDFTIDIDGSSWDLIRKENIKSSDRVKISGYINNEEEASKPLLKIINIIKIDDVKEAF